MFIIDEVLDLQNKYETNDPIEIAEELGIIVCHEDLGTINGYYNAAFNKKFIHINSGLPGYKRRFVAAHELGHAILHPESNTPFMREYTLLSTQKLEMEANKFAVHLLISDAEIEECQEYTTSEMAKYFRIPEKIMELRLNK